VAAVTFAARFRQLLALVGAPETTQDLRVAVLALAVLAPVYALIAWTVSGSVWVAVVAPVVLAAAHAAYDLVCLSLRVVLYPGAALQTPPCVAPPSLSGVLPHWASPTPASPAVAPHEPAASKEVVLQVDQALRHLNDVVWLGDSPLVARLGMTGQTPLARGRALREQLVAAIHSLRPDGPAPKGALPPEWHAYLALRLAYVEDVPNREIMAQLFLSDSTFARLRRKAVRAVAWSLVEQRLPAT
jgi:hypothetical protein